MKLVRWLFLLPFLLFSLGCASFLSHQIPDALDRPRPCQEFYEWLDEKVREAGNQLELNVKIEHVQNPRIEAESHYYNPIHTGLIDLGLKPHCLSEEVLLEMMKFVISYKDLINTDQISRNVKWT